MKKTILALAISTAAFAANAEFAVINGTVGTAGKQSAAMDVYSVSCTGNDDYIVAYVKDNAPVKNGFVTVQIMRDVELTTPKVDKVDGDNFYSVGAIMPFADYGPYSVIVSKTEADGAVSNFGSESYTLKIGCMSQGTVSFYPFFEQTQDH